MIRRNFRNLHTVLTLAFFSGMLNAQLPEKTLDDELGFMAGITLCLHSNDYTYSYQKMIEEIRLTGADWVAISIAFYQKDIHTSHIDKLKDNPARIRQLRSTIRSAHKKKMKVFLLPIIQVLERDNGEWRGQLKPSDQKLWQQSYSELILSLAVLADEESVEMMAVGSELSSMESRDTFWQKLVRQTKQLYSGKITYSLNWDALNKRAFFNDLDLLGVSGYFPLSRYTAPGKRTLDNSWRRIKRNLTDFLNEVEVPFFFSEIGYRSVNGANREPWNHESDKKLDIKEQYDCYDAFFRNWTNEKDLLGVFIYEWFGTGGLKDKGYTPKDKPAYQLLTHYFAERQKKNTQIIKNTDRSR